MVETVDAAGYRVKRRYNDAGDLMEEIDQLNRKTEHTYDNQHRRTSTKDALGHTMFWDYNAFGKITTITDALGRITRMTYDDYNAWPARDAHRCRGKVTWFASR